MHITCTSKLYPTFQWNDEWIQRKKPKIDRKCKIENYLSLAYDEYVIL